MSLECSKRFSQAAPNCHVCSDLAANNDAATCSPHGCRMMSNVGASSTSDEWGVTDALISPLSVRREME